MVGKKRDNSRLEHCFLELLKAGLWKGEPSTDGFPLTANEWNAVLQISMKQAVLGIVYDGMTSLPSSLLPPEEDMKIWTRYIQNMERQYLSHIRMLNYLLVRYELEGGMTPALLKGLGLSSYYPDIRHRSCGDIDLLFMGDEKAEEANRLAEQWGLEVERGRHGESNYTIKGVLVEIHARLLHQNSPFISKKTKQQLHIALENGEAFCQREIEGVPVRVLQPLYNNLLLATHSLKHVLNEGIGMRQLCDTAMFLKAEHEHIDAGRFRQLLSDWGVERWGNLTYAFCVKVLGMPQKLLPYSIDIDQYDTDLLLDEVWRTGNFGEMDCINPDRPENAFAGKLFTGKRLFSKAWRFYRYAPGETFAVPFKSTWSSFYRMIRH